MSFEIVNVSAGYGDKYILKEIKLKVEHSQVISIVGKNGSGKSTLINAIMGFLPKMEGDILIDNKKVKSPLWKQKFSYGISYIPQYDRVIKRLSVLENIKLAAWYIKQADFGSRFETLMSLSPFNKLSNFLNRKAGTLSGGEQFLLALTCSEIAINHARYYFFDEPTAGMDRDNMSDICDILSSLAQDTTNMIFLVEQDLRTAFGLADRVVTMVAIKGGSAYTTKELSPEDVQGIRDMLLQRSDLSPEQITSQLKDLL
jgi:ABC-type branched-subunit amino acid transport system ATPase component